MNDLFSSSFSRSDQGNNHYHVIQMTELTGGDNLDKFFEEVDSLKKELNELERLKESLRTSHEQSKTLHNAKAVKDLRSRMNDIESHVARAQSFVRGGAEQLQTARKHQKWICYATMIPLVIILFLFLFAVR